jgi:hypothetical protein
MNSEPLSSRYLVERELLGLRRPWIFSSDQNYDSWLTEVADELMTFRKLVDEAKKKDTKKKFAKGVAEYAEAVTRAATDLGRRETRLSILKDRLNTALLEAA